MGWFLIIIVLPLVAPVALILPYKMLPRSAGVRDRARFMVAVKDGQLCWGAIAFCAAGLYELDSSTRVRDIYPGWATGGLVVLLVAASFFAAGGAIFTTEDTRPETEGWCSHYRTFLCSLVVTVLASATFALVHFELV